MAPLELLHQMILQLDGTPYEPFVNALLVVAILAAVGRVVAWALGKTGRDAMKRFFSYAGTAFFGEEPYAPNWEKWRIRIEPYTTLLFALVVFGIGLIMAIVIGTAIALAISHAPWWGVAVAFACFMLSLQYSRSGLVMASWAHHRIRRNSA